jgi:AraC-like DNA-binding protein
MLDERSFRLTPTTHDGGDLRSGLYSGFVTRQEGCTVPRYVCAWVLRGHGRFRSEDAEEQELAPGRCFQRFPGRRHDILFDEPDTAAYWFAGLPPDFSRALALLGHADHQQPVIEPGCDSRLLRRALVYHDGIASCPDSELGPRMAEAFAIICELHQRHQRQRALALAPWLDRACSLLQDADVPIPRLAQECGLSPSGFREHFRRATGLSPIRWRIRHRITRARELLLGGRSCLEVAIQLGYPSVQSFTRQFHQEMRQPPSHWLATQQPERL